jgi:hypothetical protein
MSKRSTAIMSVVLISWISAQSSAAHTGPPFPILADGQIPDYTVSIWADPDIGQAVFYVVMEPRTRNYPQTVSSVEFWVEPVSERLPRRFYPMNQQKARHLLRYVATPEFDTQEFWKTGVSIKLADGSTYEFTAEVESTPPGLGPWDLVVYIFPVVLFGALWAMVMVRKVRKKGTARPIKCPQTGRRLEPDLA